MFWGLIMEPGRRYTQEVKKAFHVSMASLDGSNATKDPVQVMLGYEGRTFLLCTLRCPDLLQCSLDLEFKAGTQISFATNGKGHVHLTGYLTDDFDTDNEEESDDEDLAEDLGIEDALDILKGKKRLAKPMENGKAKKSKATSSKPESEEDTDEPSDAEEEDEDDDSDTSLLEEVNEEEDEGDEEGEEEEDEDDEDGDEDDDEEDASSMSEEEEAPKGAKKAKVNGAVKTDKQDQKTAAQPKKGIKKIVQGGVIIEDLQEGQGQGAKRGKYVNVYYEGRLKSNNKVFDSLQKGAGFNFRLGSGEVIKGWDIGIVGMKPGGKRRITCPPAMAYGPKGSPPTIPPNSTLVFDVVMKKIR